MLPSKDEPNGTEKLTHTTLGEKKQAQSDMPRADPSSGSTKAGTLIS